MELLQDKDVHGGGEPRTGQGYVHKQFTLQDDEWHWIRIRSKDVIQRVDWSILLEIGEVDVRVESSIGWISNVDSDHTEEVVPEFKIDHNAQEAEREGEAATAQTVFVGFRRDSAGEPEVDAMILTSTRS